MSRTAICLSLAVLCWGTHVQSDDTRPVTEKNRSNPPAESTGQDAVERGDRIRETVRDVVEKGLKRAEASQHDMNAQLADCFLIQNREEIELARFAVDHAKDERVKKFAQTMILDHEAFRDKLKGFAGHSDQILGQQTSPATTNLTPIVPLPTDTPTFRLEGKRGNRIDVTASKVPSGSISEDWFQMELNAAQKCRKMSQESLGKLSGIQFDRAYMGSQMGMHIGLLSKLQAADEFATGDLHQVLHDAQTTVDQHRTHAEELYHDLMAEVKTAE